MKENYNHPLAVSHTGTKGKTYSEFDKHGRTLYHLENDYWVMKFYVDEGHITTPYYVIHKYSVLYNTLPFYKN